MAGDETTRGRRRTLGVLGLGAVVAGLIGGGVLLGPALGQDRQSDDATEEGGTTDAPALPTEAITRGDLTETADGVGTVGHGTAWDVPIQAQGVVTDSPERGDVIEPGQALIHVAGQPVHLAEGSTPLYRELRYESAASRRLKGDDVAQLQRFLLDLGFDDAGRLEADGEFGRTTQRAVKAWQKDLGREQTGRVDRTQLIFSPGPLRVETAPRVGADFDRLEVTDAAQEVTATFDRKERPFVPVGAEVGIEIDDDETTTGTVTDVASEVGDDGTTRLSVTIEPRSTIPGEVERVTVEASRVRATDALTVSVRAVVALASGGYGLEVATPAGPELRRVELGVVVDDRVEISGDIGEGDEVHVPRQVGGE